MAIKNADEFLALQYSRRGVASSFEAALMQLLVKSDNHNGAFIRYIWGEKIAGMAGREQALAAKERAIRMIDHQSGEGGHASKN